MGRLCGVFLFCKGKLCFSPPYAAWASFYEQDGHKMLGGFM